MDWNGVAPTFSIYTPTQNASGGTDGRFVGSTKPADPSSTYASPFNAVVIVAKASELGLKAGDQISGFLAGVSQSAAGRITELMDQMPDSLAFTASERYGPYTVNSNQLCRPNSPPTAVLTATPTSGTAPLTVHFDGSGSYDPDTAPPPDTIASYTFDFGDGSQPVTQSTPTISHTYSNPGNYPARLSVTDSRGLASLNTAEVTIQAVSPPPTITGVLASPTNIQEGSSATYTISISPAVFQPVTVNYLMSGKATQGSDYTLTGPAGKVTIPGGQTSATVRLNALIDNVKEKPETAIMTIQPGSGYQLATSTGKKKKSKAPSATVTISD